MTDFGSAASPAPMTVGRILDRTFRLMRAYWQTFFAIALVPAVAIGALATFAIVFWFRTIWSPIFTHPAGLPHIPVYSLIWMFGMMFGIGFLVVPVFVLYAPAAFYAATQANLGIKVSFGEAYSVSWRHYGRYLWLMVLLLAYFYLPLVVMGALIGGGARLMFHVSQPGTLPVGLFALFPAAALGYCGFLVYCVLIMLRFALAYPASVMEGIPARVALRRSTTLTCGARGRIFLVLLVVYVVTYAANMVLMNFAGLVAFIIAMPAMAAQPAGAGAWITIGAVVWFPMTVLYAVFTYAAMTTALAVLYHDQRWRKDAVAPSALPA